MSAQSEDKLLITKGGEAAFELFERMKTDRDRERAQVHDDARSLEFVLFIAEMRYDDEGWLRSAVEWFRDEVLSHTPRRH